MSNMYAIKDTTLTALGDAVRRQTGKYIGVEEKGEPFYIGEFIPAEMDFEKEIYSQTYLTKTINLKELLGDKYEYTKYLYFESEYTAESAGVVRYLSLQKDGNTGLESFITNESPYAEENKSGFISYSTPVDTPFIRVVMYNSNLNKSAKLKLKLWACDANKKYLGLNKYTPLEMADAIDGLMAIPDKAFNITGNCQYRFAFNGSNWLIDNYGDKITTKDISNANNMFYFSDTLKEIPFEFNMAKNGSIEYMFNNCHQLLHSPKVNYPELTSHIKFSNIFSGCYRIQEISEWLVDLLERDYNLPTSNTTFQPWNNLFSSCRSIRKIPDRAMKYIRNDNMTGYYYGVCYSNPFGGMFCLDELVGVHCDNYNYTSNQFSGFFSNLYRVKDITFATNDDGTPVVRPWKSQTIDLSSYMGYAVYNYNILTDATTSITADKQVKDDATYQALKNDPDWFSLDVNYSRYNHDSAVNTINSLPDCSATGTNTIKFKGQAGALTDGGAINTLTEEEIAVAAAKGWSVAFV